MFSVDLSLIISRLKLSQSLDDLVQWPYYPEVTVETPTGCLCPPSGVCGQTLKENPVPFFLQGPGRLSALENRVSLTSQSVIRVIKPVFVVCDWVLFWRVILKLPLLEIRSLVNVCLCMEGHPILQPHISVAREIYSLNVKIEVWNTMFLNFLFVLFFGRSIWILASPTRDRIRASWIGSMGS